nr:unnamed protein product [Digitaria exilis]
MESPGPSAPPATGSMLAAPNAGVLPPDVLFDVLLRLSAKLLCRLRAVCRSWRALTSDPLFTGAHAARHPLFLANFRDDHTHVNVVDLSGSVVKRIPNVYGLLLPTSLDLACAMTVWDSCHVFDPSTGTVCVLPEPSGGGCGSKESKQAARLFRVWEDHCYWRVQGSHRQHWFWFQFQSTAVESNAGR